MNEVMKMRQEVREREWIERIRECRSSGRTVKDWCEEKGICRKTYYYHLRMVREKLCEEYRKATMEEPHVSVAGAKARDIVPVKSPGLATTTPDRSQSVVPLRTVSSPEIVIESGETRVSIKGGISSDSISAIIGALKRC
ncbi:MAG: hypothetical protein J6X56_04675 [Ruminococcus sp.]|nr:hypothetical protein [Ruminococcus sp.]